jgi:putative Mn2+ efflux pump MntP
MTLFEIILIGIALSMDAFAVCIASAMVYTNMTTARKLSMPVAFGLFQGIMPILGYYLGSLFSSFIEKWSGPISLVILGVIGINMIREGFSKEEEESTKQLTLKVLFVQAVATSIDAFAVGVSFAASGVAIWTSAPIIAVTTFILSLIAVFVGVKVGEKLGQKAEILGGLILIIIGIKALF